MDLVSSVKDTYLFINIKATGLCMFSVTSMKLIVVAKIPDETVCHKLSVSSDPLNTTKGNRSSLLAILTNTKKMLLYL